MGIKIAIRLILILLNTCFCSFCGFSQARDTVVAGVYVDNLYDLDFSKGAFHADFWIWFRYRDSAFHFNRGLEQLNAKESQTEIENSGFSAGRYWYERKIKSEVVAPWKVESFPFDKQSIQIEVEVIDRDTSSFQLLFDSLNGQVSKQFNLNEWTLKHVSFHRNIRTYPTKFGDLSQKTSSYFSIAIDLDLERVYLGLFLKLFIGVFVAAAIALSALFISPRHSDPRYGLPVGALFASIGNKYIVDGIIPETSELTLVDKIHFLTFFLIMMVIIISIISQRRLEKGHRRVSVLLDRNSFWALLIFYILTIVIWILF